MDALRRRFILSPVSSVPSPSSSSWSADQCSSAASFASAYVGAAARCLSVLSASKSSSPLLAPLDLPALVAARDLEAELCYAQASSRSGSSVSFVEDSLPDTDAAVQLSAQSEDDACCDAVAVVDAPDAPAFQTTRRWNRRRAKGGFHYSGPLAAFGAPITFGVRYGFLSSSTLVALRCELPKGITSSPGDTLLQFCLEQFSSPAWWPPKEHLPRSLKMEEMTTRRGRAHASRSREPKKGKHHGGNKDEKKKNIKPR